MLKYLVLVAAIVSAIIYFFVASHPRRGFPTSVEELRRRVPLLAAEPSHDVSGNRWDWKVPAGELTLSVSAYGTRDNITAMKLVTSLHDDALIDGIAVLAAAIVSGVSSDTDPQTTRVWMTTTLQTRGSKGALGTSSGPVRSGATNEVLGGAPETRRISGVRVVAARFGTASGVGARFLPVDIGDE